MDYDICIIGAGIAGLYCALELSKTKTKSKSKSKTKKLKRTGETLRKAFNFKIFKSRKNRH